MFSKSTLNDIRERISIVTLVGERVPLKRAGRNFKGRCPFHNEKTPSFNVSDDKGIYHCFGCGEGGDIFQFIIKFDGLSFSEAVKYLAERAGVDLPRDDSQYDKTKEDEISRRKRYYFRINEIARDFFIAGLSDEKKGASARAFLQHREIIEEISTQLFLGFADNSWDALVFHLTEKKVPLEMASDLGLIKKRETGGYYDFFRNRIMFPIVSPRGEVLGFSGRDIGGAEAAKYLNSPDSLIYHKSNSVFGLNLAQAGIRNEDLVILVEGNIDLAALHQAGITNVVAPLGTALTDGHLKLLRRYTENFVLIFDGDEAGRRAALRSLEIFIGEGLTPRVVPLPQGEDPDTLIKKEGKEGFLKRVRSAIPLFEYFVDCAMAEAGADAAGKVSALKKIVPVLGLVSDAASQSVYRRYAARRLDVDEQAISSSIAQQRRGGAVSASPAAAHFEPASPLVASSAERILAESLYCRPDMAGTVFEVLEPQLFENAWCRMVVDIAYSYWKEKHVLKVGEIIENVEDAELAAQLRHISLNADKFADDELAGLLKDCIAHIKKRPAEERVGWLNSEIRRAETEGDELKLLALLEEKKELAARIRYQKSEARGQKI